MEWWVTHFLSPWLLPPLDLLAVCALGLALVRKHRRTGVAISAVGLALLAVLATPMVGHSLVASLESGLQPITVAQVRGSGAGAIVILGSGRRFAPEFDGQTVSDGALGRMRYGARLARETQLPVLVTGGKPGGGSHSEADLMAEALEQDFGVKVRWRETESINTIENARFSSKILVDAGVKRVVLVTEASHMQRSIARFQAAGLEVVPAPTAFHIRSAYTPIDLLPTAGGLFYSSRALHEWLGMVVTRARGA